MLNRDAILQADDLNHRDVDVPEWGGKVRIRALTAAERDRIEQEFRTANKTNRPVENVRARFAVLVCIDDQGNRLFKDADAEALGKKSAKALDRIFDAGMELNALTPDEVQELEKN